MAQRHTLQFEELDFAGSNPAGSIKTSGCSAVGSAGVSGMPGRRFVSEAVQSTSLPLRLRVVDDS